MKQGKLAAVGLSLVGVLGCNSNGKRVGDAGPDSGYALPAKPLSPLAACIELATYEANFEVDCGRLAGSDVGDGGSGYIGAQCPPAVFATEEAAYRAGTLAYSGVAVTCLVNALLSISISESATITCNVGYPELDAVCGQIAWGTLGPGASCNDQYACGNGLYCDTPTPGACGVCAEDVGIGGSCGFQAAGAFCNGGTCNGNVCQPFATEGQQCELGLLCRPPMTCLADGCQFPEAADGGCNTTADCADGLSCNAFSSRCNAATGVGGDCANQPCTWGEACTMVDAGFRCVPLLAGGHCITTDAGPQCPEFESCRDGGCFPLAPLDGGCGTSADCWLGACSSGRCQLLPNGAGCNAASQCESFICDNVSSDACVAACPQG